MKVKLYVGATLAEGAQLCLSARLFIPGWDLNPTLKSMRDWSTHPGKLAVCFDRGQPVALCLHANRMLMAFCRKDYRRMGLASRCFQALDLKDELTESWAGEGVTGTLEFWKSNGVFARPRHRARISA